MTHLVVQEIEKKFAAKKVPVLRPGYTVRVHQKIKEGEKERVQIFEGLVISLNSGLGSSKMFTVRRIVEGIGVEKIFPMFSPNVVKIEVTKTSRVRRAKLFYMRKLAGKSARLRSKLGLTEKDEKLSRSKETLMNAMGIEKAAEAPKKETTEEVMMDNVETTTTATTEPEKDPAIE